MLELSLKQTFCRDSAMKEQCSLKIGSYPVLSNHLWSSGFEPSSLHLSNEKNLGWLFDTGDSTTQFYRGYDKQL